jgi:Rrf2 family protein
MRLSQRTEYAIIALTILAREGRACTAKQLAAGCGTSPLFIQQIFSELKKQGIVTSNVGRSGGFSLRKPAEKIMLAEIVRLFDEVIAPSPSVSKYHYRSTPIERNSKALRVFREIRDQVAEILEKRSIASLL